MSRDQEPGWQKPDDEVRPDPAAFDAQLGDLVAYCRAVTGREEDAVSTAHGVLDWAQSLLTDPHRLRAWLFARARVEILAASEPQAREIFDLVHRYGIRPEDLPVVLGISPVEADELLAAAEEEAGWDDRAGRDYSAYLNEGQLDLPAVESRGEMFDTQLPGLVAYCRALIGRQDDALSVAHAVLGSAQFLLTDPDGLRAWMFALARMQMIGDAAPGPQEILDLVHQHGIRAEDLPIVLGISPIETDQLLAAAEEEYAGSAFSSWHRDADARHSGGQHDDRSWDDRAAAWETSAARDDDVSWDDGAGWDDGTNWDDGADWDEALGPKSHRLQDIHDLFRGPPESAGRHAAPVVGGAGLRQALARGHVPAAAATGIVVAVIGVGAAFLAASHSPPPSQAGQQTKHRPPAAAQSPATTHSPAPAVTPTQRTSQPVTVVLPPPPPAPAPTSSKPSPKPTSSSPKPSPSPKHSSSPPPSSPPPSSPPPTPTPTPSPTLT